jgi:hypothetical protein
MSNETVYFRAHCDWQIWGEFYGTMTIAEWVNDKLKIWQGADGTDGRENFFLHDYQVTEELKDGPWGLMMARFWVIMRVNVDELNDVHDIIKSRLDEMVGDKDVSVRFTQRLLEVPPLPTF